MSTQNESHKTKDHSVIKDWTEKRNGHPVMVDEDNSSDEGGVLRINFEENDNENLQKIEWDRFFEVFDNNNLEFLYQEKTGEGELSRFCKFVD